MGIFGIMRGVEQTRPILYGVADYAEMRKANAWFIDRTAKIRDLEATRYAIFLRPRRFGKSLLMSILEAYYDVHYADRFEEFFAGTDIGSNPTDERGKYLVLKFDFSSVSKDASQVEMDFNDYCAPPARPRIPRRRVRIERRGVKVVPTLTEFLDWLEQ